MLPPGFFHWAAVVGCLSGDLLGLIPQGRVVGMDFSAGAIDLAKQRAAEFSLSIEYRIADLNVISELEREAFDVVLRRTLYTISASWSVCSFRFAIVFQPTDF